MPRGIPRQGIIEWYDKHEGQREQYYDDTRTAPDGETEYNIGGDSWYTKWEIKNNVPQIEPKILFTQDGERMYYTNDLMTAEEFEEWIGECEHWEDWARDIERQDDPDY